MVWGIQSLLLGIPWMDPNWLLDHFHAEFIWVSLAIVFIECGLLFPFLPGDTLLVAVGLFIAGGKLDLNIFVALGAFTLAAFLGNVTGYALGRGIGERLGDHDGRLVKKKHLEQTHEFFNRHGSKALVIGRFVPFVRTYITLVAGVTDMPRRKFLVWSAVAPSTREAWMYEAGMASIAEVKMIMPNDAPRKPLTRMTMIQGAPSTQFCGATLSGATS